MLNRDNASVWRDLAQLAAEALAIGIIFSVLLALAVLVVARGSRGDEFAAARLAPVEIGAASSVGWPLRGMGTAERGGPVGDNRTRGAVCDHCERSNQPSLPPSAESAA